MKAQSSGWRSMKAVVPQIHEPHTADKQDLYEAARIAARVLDLPSSCRFVLEHLVGAYGGKLIRGRMIVWPSNSFLESRTGISERTIRFALARLIELGVIAAKDSANGKRFARMNRHGEITDAFGFDLSPILNRLSEWTDMFVAIKDRERERKVAFDTITIHRRATQEALRALSEWYPEEDTTELTTRVLKLLKETPRRASKGSTEGYVEAWENIREEAETKFHTASGGNNCRHKDNNKYALKNSCNNAYENAETESTEPQPADLRDLQRACPDAMEFMGDIRSDGQLVAAAGRLRGSYGISPSAWDEALKDIGPLPAAATFIMVLQMQINPAPGVEHIRNLGGYYRAMVRLLREGRINLAKEIRKMQLARARFD